MMRKCSFTLFLLLLVVVPVLLLGPGTGRAADEGNGHGAVKFLGATAVPGTTRNTSGGKMYVFDISWVDQGTQLYYLADRSNAVVDVVNAKTGAFVKQIQGASTAQPGGFAGFSGNNDTSGPNGVVVVGNWLIVTDYPSRVVSIDLMTDTVVSDVRTGGVNRADELAYDPEDGLLLVVNNADSPPFATLIQLNTQNGNLTVGQRITFDAAHGVDATNGAEQPAWNSHTGKFYISIPQVGADISHGAVARIDPKAAMVDAVFPVNFCQPAGLTLFGPHQDLLLGCSVIFDTAGQPWSATDPNTAAPLQIIMDAHAGAIDAKVAGVGGSDEVWFNHGDGRYYTASRVNPGGPALGVIDAESQTLVQVAPTINVPAVSGVHPAGTAHSVAVNSHNNHVFVPLPANNVFTNCLTGCIAVYGTE